MRRFLILYALLLPVLFVVGTGVSVLVFHHVDLRTVVLIGLLVVPAFQSAVVCAVGGGVFTRRLVQDLAEGLRPVLSRSLLGADALLLGVGWAQPRQPLVGLAAEVSAQPLWMGLKAVIAGLLVAFVCRRLPSRERPWPAVLSAGLLAWGLDAFRPWLRLLPDHVLAGKPQVLRWIAVFAPLFIISLTVLLGAADRLERRARGAGLLVETAVAFAFLAALVAVPGFYLRPALVPPWSSLVLICGSLAMTFVLMGGLRALSAPAAGGTG